MQQRHSFTAINSTFIVDAQYVFVKELGQGAYGAVVAAKHRQSGEGCAIKKITNINTKVSQPFTCILLFAFIVILSIIHSLLLENFNETMSPRNQVYNRSLAFLFNVHSKLLVLNLVFWFISEAIRMSAPFSQLLLYCQELIVLNVRVDNMSV